MWNILNGRSNGQERDRAWKWKTEEELKKRQGKEFGASPKNVERREMSSFEEAGRGSKL